ncbi:MAG TPA: polysaccharide biosynthesis/export family protein [Candidatus Binatia bacterium]|jgi:polysaccharide export outer membrane protein|nr:polysaccharide biosynthesis/export family protein [Candidatus Binatia bacterium]
MKRIFFFTLMGVLLSSTVVYAAETAPEHTIPQVSADDGAYHIGPEDVLDISVWKNVDLTRRVPVRPDGKISLPLVNDVQAAGLTPLELRDVLSRKLEAYMPSPQVSVTVAEVHSFKVSVLGEVPFPGRHMLQSRATVLDALALSGGLKEFAARSRIVILRPSSKGTQRIPFDYNKVVSGDGAQNIYLQPGDVVLVP